MARRRSFLSGALQGFATGLGGELTRRRDLQQQRKERGEAAQLAMLPGLIQQALKYQEGEVPEESVLGLQEAMRSILGPMGAEVPDIGLDKFRPTEATLTKGMRGQITGAPTAEAVPDLERILAGLSEVPGGDKLIAPTLGEMPPPVPSGPVGPPAEATQQPLPSRQFGPVQPRAVKQLEQLAGTQRDRLLAGETAQHKRALGRTLETEEATARQGKALEAEFFPGDMARAAQMEGATSMARLPAQKELAKFSADQQKAIVRLQSTLSKQFGTVRPLESIKLDKDLQLFGPDGKVTQVVPAGVEGIVMIDTQGKPVAFIPAKPTGTPTRPSLGQQLLDKLTPEQLQEQLGLVPTRTGTPPALPESPLSPAETEALREELRRRGRVP